LINLKKIPKLVMPDMEISSYKPFLPLTFLPLPTGTGGDVGVKDSLRVFVDVFLRGGGSIVVLRGIVVFF
jgi:hypothetical protein